MTTRETEQRRVFTDAAHFARRASSARVFVAMATLTAAMFVAGSAAAQFAPRETIRPDIAPPEQAPQVGERPELEATPRPDLPPEAAAIRFTLNQLSITGSTVYDVAEFESLYEEFLGVEINLETLRDIADRIEAKYRGDEYVATRALVPAQRIKDGAVEIRIFEGSIRNIIIRGDVGLSEPLVKSYLAKLRTGEPLRWPEAERYLLLARDVPGLSLTGTLRKTPGVEAGGVDLIVDVAHKQFEGFANVQNYSAEPTGPWTLSGGASMNNPLGFGDQLQGVGLITIPEFEEQVVAQINYQARFGDEGLASYSTLSYSLSQPGEELEVLDLEETAWIFDTRMEYPVFRSRGMNLWTSAGIELVNQDTQGPIDTEDNIRALYGRARWAVAAPLSTVFEGAFDLRAGLDIWDATKAEDTNKSRLDADGQFVLGRVDMSTTTPLPHGISLFLRGRGQISDQPLLSYEEFSLGNLTLGRGFDPGEVQGDEGVAGTIELRLNRPEFTNEWFEDTQFYAFADGGYVWNSPESIVDEADMNSIGGGVRFRIQETILGDLTYAHPTSGGSAFPGAPDPEDTWLFRLTKLF